MGTYLQSAGLTKHSVEVSRLHTAESVGDKSWGGVSSVSFLSISLSLSFSLSLSVSLSIDLSLSLCIPFFVHRFCLQSTQ
jgi:hypothetical protein